MRTHGQLKYVPPDTPWSGRYGTWGVKCRPDVMIKIKRLFPRASNLRSGVITLSATPEVARDLEWVTERWPMEMTDETAAILHDDARTHREQETTVHDILSGNRPHVEFDKPVRPAREYQLVAADLALATGRLLLADELGLGKTFSAILVLRNYAALPALVVCPTHLPKQWEQEIAKTLPWLRTHIVKSGTPYDPKRKRASKGYDPDVLIMGYAKLRGWGHTLNGRVNTVIFDEAQELRHSGTAKYVAAGLVADGASYKLGLSATPVFNYGGEIHNIFSILAPDALGERDEFVREWGAGDRGSMNPDNISVRDPAALGIYLRDQGLMLRRTRKDVQRELPYGEPVRIPHSIESDGDVFDKLAGDAVELAEMIVNRSRTKSELFRASGEFDWKMRQATGIAKAPYVADFADLLLESESKIILFGWHRKVYDIWMQKLAHHKPVLFSGSESASQKEKSKQLFLIDEDVRILIMSLRSGAGLDGLQGVCHVGVFGELDWSPAMHSQCVGRYARDGQLEESIAYFLVSDHGTDPIMAEVLQVKRMQSEPLNDPDAAMLKDAPDVQGRIKRLADDLLERRKGKR